MKKGTSLSELTLAELKTKKKGIQSATIGLGIVMLISFFVLLYLAITSKKPALMAIGGCFSITLLPVLISLKQINEEIKKRTL